MATLQKIRSMGWVLVVIVGLAMLAFILGDFMNSGSSFFHRAEQYVGEIEGEDIHITDFENAREQLSEVYKIEVGRNDLDEEIQSNINNQVWQLMVMQHTLGAQAQKIGMTVTDDELADKCIGEHPHQIIAQRPAFRDQSGQFNRVALIQFLAGLDQAANDPSQAQNIKQAQTYWMYWENAVRLTWLQEKYTDLLQELVGANKLDAEQNGKAALTTANVKYVMQPYYSVPDSTIKVTNSDIRDLYKQKKEQFKQEPSRSLQYIAFDIKPSETDFQDAEAWIQKLEEEFNTTDDIAGVVNPNSDIIYNGQNYSESTIPAQFKEWAFQKGRKAGDVTGIQFENDTYATARMMQTGYSLPDSVELRGTILASEEELDSLKAEWKKGNFGTSKETQWVTEAMLNRDIAEKAFSGQKGSIFTVPYGTGVQAIQIVDKGAATPKVKVAILSRSVTPSSKTYAALYNAAKQFVVNNHTEDAFKAAAEEANMEVETAYNLQKSTHQVNNLKQSRPIVRWANKAKEGDVSDVFECGDKFVVAVLTEVKDGEYRSINEVQAELRMEILRDKRAEVIIKNLKDATSLQEAADLASAEIKTAEGVTLASYRFGDAGMEPAVIGTAIRLNEGELSEPVKGVQGVYVLQSENKTTTEQEINIDQQIQQLKSRYAYSLPYQALNLIEQKADITDNRSNFY